MVQGTSALAVYILVSQRHEEVCPRFNCPDHCTRVLWEVVPPWEKFDKLLNLFKGFALAASGHILISLICLICKE